MLCGVGITGNYRVLRGWIRLGELFGCIMGFVGNYRVFVRCVLLGELWGFTALSGRLCAKDAVILGKLLCFKDFVSVDLCRKVGSGWK